MVDFLHGRTNKGRISTLGQQFMPITQLQGMKANDFASDQYSPAEHAILTANGIGPEHHDVTVGELNRNHPYYEHAGYSYDWNRLSRDVGQHGLTTPLHVGISPRGQEPYDQEPRLLNGHHRAIMAQEQGHMFVPVTHNAQMGQGTEYGRVHRPPPTRTWEPLINEHENEAEHARWQQGPDKVHYGQGELFDQTAFNDRRTRG